VLVDRLDQGGGDVRAAALQDERHVLVGGALERDQRVGRLRLVVERHQLEFLAERAALRIDVVEDVLHLLEVGVAYLRKRTRQRVRIGDLDGDLGHHRASPRHARRQNYARNTRNKSRCHVFLRPLRPHGAFRRSESRRKFLDWQKG
jgi:hypothetical protein